MLRSIVLIILLLLSTSQVNAIGVYTEPNTGMGFVRIRGGSFIMGDITGRDKFASPAHRVTVDDFWIGKYEVTFKQYDLFCAATGREKPSDVGWGRGRRPVINVSWDDAVAFTRWLSQISGEKYRLPSVLFG